MLVFTSVNIVFTFTMYVTSNIHTNKPTVRIFIYYTMSLFAGLPNLPHFSDYGMENFGAKELDLSQIRPSLKFESQ